MIASCAPHCFLERGSYRLLLTSPTCHKVLFWSMAFFVALSSVAVAASWKTSFLGAKPLLRIGGGVGIGLGSLGLGILSLPCSSPTSYFEIDPHRCRMREGQNYDPLAGTLESWEEAGKEWKGYLMVWRSGLGSSTRFHGLLTDEILVQPVEAYLFPVRCVYKDGHRSLTFTDTYGNGIKYPKHEKFFIDPDIAVVKEKIRNHLMIDPSGDHFSQPSAL